MNVNPAELVPLDRLRANPDNPKSPFGSKYRAGFRASLEQFGFSDVLKVARNLDGTFLVLDGTSRLDELDRAGIEEVACIPVPACEEGVPGWEESRREFVLSFDRNRKVYNEDVVLAQLRDLAERGRDLKALARLTAKSNLDRLLAEASPRPMAASAGQVPAPAAMQSLVLYGPAAEVSAIRELLKTVRGRRSTLEKATAALSQSLDFLDWQDERLLAVLLATVAKFAKESDHAGPQAHPECAEEPPGQPGKTANGPKRAPTGGRAAGLPATPRRRGKGRVGAAVR